ncbi:MAG: hypothetical protein METHAR1v1_760003 [Methanothrix sp.]|nr:MAG: hypothetical protein METHAR1v1_760003 [Methanothrix sp.]
MKTKTPTPPPHVTPKLHNVILTLLSVKDVRYNTIGFRQPTGLHQQNTLQQKANST